MVRTSRRDVSPQHAGSTSGLRSGRPAFWQAGSLVSKSVSPKQEECQFSKGVLATGTRGAGEEEREIEETEETRDNKNEDPEDSETQEDSESDLGENVKARKAMTPAKPAAKEIDEHELARANFRGCCIHCRKGKAHNGQHKRRKSEEDPQTDKPVLSIDYFYMDAD